MTTTDTEKVGVTTSGTTNQRLVTILLVLLIILLALLVLGIVAGWLWMGSGIMTNNMANACIDIMRNIQGPQ